jgi:Winged helix DNA-binding domain
MILIRQLEEQGLVTRTRQPGDGRIVFVSLTGSGNAALDEYSGRIRKMAGSRQRGVQRWLPLPLEASVRRSRAHLEPDACGESGRRLEKLDPPGQLSGDPEASADPLTWREIASCGVVEAVASVDDLADESSSGASDTDFLDTAAVLHRVVRNLGGCEQQVE